MISGLTIAALILFEVVRYLTPVMQSEIMVDGGIQVTRKTNEMVIKKKKKSLTRFQYIRKNYLLPWILLSLIFLVTVRRREIQRIAYIDAIWL